jgi:hypothetical protein
VGALARTTEATFEESDSLTRNWTLGRADRKGTTAMRPVAALLSLSLLLSNVPAFGQGDAYKTGVKLENSGDLVGALAAFESIGVEKRDFNARLHIASCKKKLGRLLEAERDYEAIRTDPKADPATVETAASDLEDLRPRIPKLVVKLSAATKDVKVSIDGHDAKVPTTVTVNPGTHSIIATRGDAQVFKRDVTMAESTTIEVEVDAPAAASAPVSVAPPTTDPAKAADTGTGSSQRTWGWVGIGAGAVFAVGAIGAWAYSGKLGDDYLEKCRTSPPCNKSDESNVRTWETLSYVGAGVAIAAAGVGVTLLLTAPNEKSVAVKASANGFYLVGEF